jgi:hypothetical protein
MRRVTTGELFNGDGQGVTAATQRSRVRRETLPGNQACATDLLDARRRDAAKRRGKSDANRWPVTLPD